MLIAIKRWLKILKVKSKYKNVSFKSGANIALNTVFEGQNVIGAHSWLDGYIGYGSYIGDECTIFAKIGRYCSIGHKVTVLTGTHPTNKLVSTSPVFYSLAKQNGITYVRKQKFKEKLYADEQNKYGCIIGNDVWIGYGATIIGGVTIGDGAIVATGAVVKDDVAPYSIVAGQPAKEIKKRFTSEQINWLLDFKWWLKPEQWLIENADLFENIEEFMDKIKKDGQI